MKCPADTGIEIVSLFRERTACLPIAASIIYPG